MDGVMEPTATASGAELVEFAEVVDAARDAFAAERACWRRMVVLASSEELRRRVARGQRADRVVCLRLPTRHAHAIAGELRAVGYRVIVGGPPEEPGDEDRGRTFTAWLEAGDPRDAAATVAFNAAAGI